VFQAVVPVHSFYSSHHFNFCSLSYVVCLYTMPPKKSAASSKASTATPYVWSMIAVFSSSFFPSLWHVFIQLWSSNPRGRGPKKPFKSTEFIDDEAEV
jgi:hypothetical protein